MTAPSAIPGTTRTTRNRKLECPCGYAVRASRSMMARGLPTCPDGHRLIPSALEDATWAESEGLITTGDLEAHPEYGEYVDAVRSVQHGQAGPGRSLKLEAKRAAEGRELDRPETIAFERVAKSRAAAAYAARIAAIEPHRFGGAPSTDSIPF
jgi:hypothetical protein